MSYIIMAIQEEGSETRISDYDTTIDGFDTEDQASHALRQAWNDYPEFRQIWVEELKDQFYWAQRIFSEDYDPFYEEERF